MNSKLYCVFLCFFISLTAIAQFNNLKFENIDTVDGLSSSTCIEIFQDADGYLWFGTIDGLNKYNGYDIEIFRPILNDSTSISNIRVNTIVSDKNDNLWIGTNNGLNFFNKETNQFSRIYIYNNVSLYSNKSEVINKLLYNDITNTIWAATNNGAVKIILEDDYIHPKNLKIKHYVNYRSSTNTLDNNNVNTILKDEYNNIWISTNGPYLNKYNRAKDNFDRVLIEKEKNYELNHISKRVFIDNDGDFWIGNDLSNLVLWTKKENTFSHLSIVKNPISINDFYQDANGVIWISTYGHGLFLFDKNSGELKEQIVENPSDPFSLPNNQPTKIFKDRNDNLWIGSYDKGVSKLDKSKSLFGHHYYQPNNIKGLNGKIIQSVLEDSKQRIWLSAYNGGLNLFDEETRTFKHFEYNAKNDNSLSSNKILNSFESSDGSIWLCTFDGGLNKFNPDTYKVERFLHNEQDSLSIGQNSVWAGVEDSRKRIWLGLRSEGLSIYNPNNNKFYSFKDSYDNVNNLASNFVLSLFIDSKNRLFVGTNSGLNVLDLNTQKDFIPKKIDFSKIDIDGIEGGRINYITEDHLGNIWLGEDSGMYKLDSNLNLLKSYTSQDGLPNNLVVGIKEDDDKNIWIITKSGLSVLNPETHYFKNFNLHDGIQGAEYQKKSIHKTKDGRIIAGGINGFNIFHPKDVSKKDSIELLPRITAFKLNNKNVKSGDSVNGRILLKKNISATKNLVLKHNENNLSFTFEALFINNPEQVKYAYKMHGIDDEYVYVGANRVVNYSNLEQDNYTFEVKASIDEKWEKQSSTSINIKILPPTYKTWWAYTLYLILGCLLFWFFLNLYRKNIQESQKHNLDLMKLQFFINVSHEFRTPLTLILNPLDKILYNLNNSEVIKSSALSAQRSARRLLHLVNQLLDYRKMDAGMAPLQLEKGDIVKFLEDIFMLFKDLAFKKKIDYRFESNTDKIISVFDFDKVEKIITNLISNAIRFTDYGGSIEVSINIVEAQRNNKPVFLKGIVNKSKKYAEIIVKDDGIGMDKEQLDNVFSRFNNLDASKTGTGIGLNFTKALVEIHKGEISVNSQINKGSEFVVKLPLGIEDKVGLVENVKNEFLINSMKSAEYEMLISNVTLESKQPKTKTLDANSHKILIVEDNRELRAHLKDDLNDDYEVIEAVNGEEGLKMVLKYYPDIIISDVMMPKMDGFEMCKALKTKFETCHIPIILLTARTREEDLISGYKNGADAYLQKPFKMNMLKVRVQNLLESQKRIREKFSKLGAILPSSELTTNSLDEAFIEKTTKIILDNISDSDFKLDDILKEVGIGKSHFFRKINSITGQNPSNFIRTIRLKYASELLLNSNYSIKEVSHMSGFNSPTYFGKTFRELFNVTPREYIDENKKSH